MTQRHSSMSPEPDLTPDCARCQALCCVLLPFDMGPAFGFDKPAGEVCRHLGGDNRCKIHDGLKAQGFSGCAAYSCLGAGQRATALFASAGAWRENSERLANLDLAFRLLRRVHEALSLLKSAGQFALPSEAEERRKDLLQRLDAGRDWTLDALDRAMARGGVLDEVRAYLAGLRLVVRQEAEAPKGSPAAIKPPRR